MLCNFFFGRVRIDSQEIERAHHHAWCAEAALKAVVFAKCDLNWMHGAIGISDVKLAHLIALTAIRVFPAQAASLGLVLRQPQPSSAACGPR